MYLVFNTDLDLKMKYFEIIEVINIYTEKEFLKANKRLSFELSKNLLNSNLLHA